MENGQSIERNDLEAQWHGSTPNIYLNPFLMIHIVQQNAKIIKCSLNYPMPLQFYTGLPGKLGSREVAPAIFPSADQVNSTRVSIGMSSVV
jgi:hypothetical protein